MRPFAWILAPVLGLLACSETAPTEVSPDGGPVGADGGEACGPPPGEWKEGIDPPAFCVKEVTGSVVAEGGGPLADLTMTVCGRACFGAQTDASGAFRIRVDARLPDGQYTLFAHARPHHASLFVPLPSAPPERVDFAAPIELPRLSAVGVPLPPDDGPETSVQAGPISLGVPAATSWELAFEDAVDEIDGRMLRFAKVPVDRAPSFAAGAVLVYALAPFGAVTSKPVSLAVAETGGLAAGTPVEVVVMDGFDIAQTNTSGRPVIAARGHVAADGTRIETDPGQGISLLTWIAIRAAK